MFRKVLGKVVIYNFNIINGKIKRKETNINTKMEVDMGIASGNANPAAYKGFAINPKLNAAVGGLIVQTPYGQGYLKSLDLPNNKAYVQLACNAEIAISAAKIQYHQQHNTNLIADEVGITGGKRPSQNGFSTLGPKSNGSGSDIGTMKSALKRGPYSPAEDSEGETTTGGHGLASDDDMMVDADAGAGAAGNNGNGARGNKRMRTFDDSY